MKDENTNADATPKVWTRDEIDEILRHRDAAVERAMVALFRLQTTDEQLQADTEVRNDVGFSMTDARAGTRFARWVLGMDDNNVKRYAPKSLNHPRASHIFRKYCKKHASPMDRARAIALKHSQQLTDIANGELEVPTRSTAP
jgi:hypothetical protein